VTEYVFSCEQCGADCGLICRACAVCPEPAGYWAWDDLTLAAYIDALEDAASTESDPGMAQTLRAHGAVMSEGWDNADALDMDALASKLSARGIPSHVSMTGGGVATLFGGDMVGQDESGEDRYTLCIGPGTFGYGVGRSFGSWGELAYGADDDGATCSYWDGPRDLDRFVDWVAFRMPEFREAMVRYMETVRTEGSGAE
jgi:hypothetical protein